MPPLLTLLSLLLLLVFVPPAPRPPPRLARVITGQNMFVTDYVNRGDRTSKVGLGTDVPR